MFQDQFPTPKLGVSKLPVSKDPEDLIPLACEGAAILCTSLLLTYTKFKIKKINLRNQSINVCNKTVTPLKKKLEHSYV